MLAELWGWKGFGQWHKIQLESSHQQFTLQPVLHNILINNLDGGTGGIATLLTKDAKLRGVDDRPGGWADTQGSLNRLEKRAVRDFTTFSEWKKQFLLLGRNGLSACQGPAGWKAAWQGRICRSWWMPNWAWARNVLVWQRWPVGPWAALASRLREVILSLYSTQRRHIWSAGLLNARYWFSGAGLVVCSTCQEKHTRVEESPALEITGDYTTGASVSVGRGWESWNCSAWGREGSVGVL